MSESAAPRHDPAAARQSMPQLSPDGRRAVAEHLSGVLLSVLLAAVTLAIFWPLGRYDFVNYDDPNYLNLSPEVRRGFDSTTFRWALTAQHHCNWHPVTTISYLIESRLFGLQNARPFHLTNVLVHTAAAVALLWALRALTGSTWRSAVVAGLFALHPMHVESVAWISERKDVLSALFMFLTIWGYARYVGAGSLGSIVGSPGSAALALRYAPGRSAREIGDSDSRSERVDQARAFGALRWYVITLVFFALGLMSKPMLVTLPFVLLLLDAWPLKRARRCGLVVEKIPMFAMVIGSSFWTYIVQRDCGAISNSAMSPLGPRLANAALSYVRYIEKTLWPSGLTVFYPYSADLTKRPLMYWPIAAVALVVITIVIVRLSKSRPYLAVGWFWFLGMLVPVIGIVQVGEQAMADRYSYLPLIGLFIIAVWGGYDLLSRWRIPRPAIGTIALIILAACSMAAAKQRTFWRNSETLFSRGLQTAPDNYIFRFYYGEALRNQNKIDQAMREYERSIALNPRHADAWCNLGMCYGKKGQFQPAYDAMMQALQLFEAEHRRNPHLHQITKKYAATYHNLGVLFMSIGDLPQAEASMAKALEIEPSHVDSQLSLAVARLRGGDAEAAETLLRQALKLEPDNQSAITQMGHVRLAQNRAAEAVRLFETALRLNPHDPDAQLNLGIALGQAGENDRAIAQLKRFAEEYPKDPRPWFQMGVLAQMRGDAGDAVVAYREVMKRDASQAAANNLAWILATHPDARLRDGVEAVRLAEALHSLSGEKAEVLDTLAAAYAEAGDFARATINAEAALKLAAANKQPQLEDEIRARLELYKQHKAYRERR